MSKVTVRVEAMLSVTTSIEIEVTEYNRLIEGMRTGGIDACRARDEIEGLVEWRDALDNFEMDDVELSLEKPKPGDTNEART